MPKGYRSFFGCGNKVNKVRYCPTIASGGREGKQVAPDVPKDDAPKKRCFYAFRTRGSKIDEGDDNDGKLLYLSLWCYKFLLSVGVWLIDGLESHRSMLHVHGV